MPEPLKPYLISEFKTGIYTYLQPWIGPKDAFEPLVNAYVYRGTVNKRAGYSKFGETLPDGKPVMGIIQRINEATGAIQLVVASTVNLYYYDPGTKTYILVGAPPTFTGNITNFFNWTNWQASAGAVSYLYFTNNVDNVGTYDGTNYAALVPAIGGGITITKALDVVVYKQRLLLILPTLSASGPQNQSIYWSAVQNPALWRVDIAGQGGFLAAPTGDIIQSVEFVRDVLVVFFTKSTWIFRFTGNNSDPFRWDKVNNTKATSAPYGSLAYDERSTSIGNTGFIACDGVNVQRYDIPIIDYYETKFSEQYYAQSFSQRYDNLNQSWTMYVSNDRDPGQFPLVGGVAPGSDSALIYNFLENTWATYKWSVPMTCMGIFYNQSGTTWADLNVSPENLWQNEDQAWNSYSNQKAAPILLAGDTSGNVYFMDNSGAVTDNGTSFSIDMVTNRWNPILAVGQKVQFGYIDIYYQVASVNPSNPIAVTLNFYVDNSNTIALSKPLTLDGPSESTTQIIATGSGASTYSGTMALDGYIVPNFFEIITTTSSGVESFDDDGIGNLVGSLGDTGTIDYNSGAWTLVLTPRTIASGLPITATFNFNNPNSFAFKRIYTNLIGEFFQMEIDPNEDAFLQFVGFILWARPAGRMTPF